MSSPFTIGRYNVGSLGDRHRPPVLLGVNRHRYATSWIDDSVETGSSTALDDDLAVAGDTSLRPRQQVWLSGSFPLVFRPR